MTVSTFTTSTSRVSKFLSIFLSVALEVWYPCGAAAPSDKFAFIRSFICSRIKKGEGLFKIQRVFSFSDLFFLFSSFLAYLDDDENKCIIGGSTADCHQRTGCMCICIPISPTYASQLASVPA
jgi:hypothetical protein